MTGPFGSVLEGRCAMAAAAAVRAVLVLCAVAAAAGVGVCRANYFASVVLQSGMDGPRDYAPLWEVGINGTGQRAALAGSGADTASCYLRADDKVHSYVKTHSAPMVDETGEGTHVAATMVGYAVSGAPHADWNGLAFGATLSVYDVLRDRAGADDDAPDGERNDDLVGTRGGVTLILPESVTDEFAFAQSEDAGVLVVTHEMPSSSALLYGTLQADVDDYLARPENSGLLVIVPAGNCGEDSKDDSCSSTGSLTISPLATAKNVLTVGATENHVRDLNPKYVTDFSSWGPTFSGRRKPDVVAPGFYTLSAFASDVTGKSEHRKTCRTIGRMGTVASAGVVGGAALLVRDYFAQGWYPYAAPMPAYARNVSAAMIKALLVNGAASTRGVRSDKSDATKSQLEGFGRVDLSTQLPLGPDPEFNLFAEMLSCNASGVVVDTLLTVETRAADLRVTVVWMDAAGDSAVNDLDLELIRNETGQRFRSNDLVSGTDSINTVERVIIENPEKGVYRVRVTCDTIAQLPTSGVQQFAVVATGSFANPSPVVNVTAVDPDYRSRRGFWPEPDDDGDDDGKDLHVQVTERADQWFTNFSDFANTKAGIGVVAACSVVFMAWCCYCCGCFDLRQAEADEKTRRREIVSVARSHADGDSSNQIYQSEGVTRFLIQGDANLQQHHRGQQMQPQHRQLSPQPQHGRAKKTHANRKSDTTDIQGVRQSNAI